MIVDLGVLCYYNWVLFRELGVFWVVEVRERFVCVYIDLELSVNKGSVFLFFIIGSKC